MTVNIFVSGSGGNWYDDPIWKDFFYYPNNVNPNGIRYDIAKINRVQVEMNGTAKFIGTDKYPIPTEKKQFVVSFQNCIYVQQELQNLGYQLKNAIDLIRNTVGGDVHINLFGHSNGGNAIARYVQAFKPYFVDNLVTCATPYNGVAWSVTPTGFLKDVTGIGYYWQPNNNLNMFVGSTGSNYNNDSYPTWLDTDGVIAVDSGACGENVYGKTVQVLKGYTHGTILHAPEVQRAVKSWFQ